MDNVIYVDFRKGRITLEEAREILGEYFYQAVFVWSMEELERAVAGSWQGGADVMGAYEAIQRHRLAGSADPRPLAPVIKIAA